MSSQRRDFRRMLYRLDLATPYPSIPALIQHFMDETALDGVVEVKMVASPPMSAPPTTKGKRSNKPQPPPSAPLQPTTSVISFRREGRDVNAIALFGPASAPSSMITTGERGGSHRGFEAASAVYDLPGMVVKKRYPPRTTLVWVFAPLIQKLLDEGADTVMFEVRSYTAGADSVRESQSTLSPVSPYGTSHSTTEASPSVLASGSTPSSGGQGQAFESAIQYAQSPVAFPHGDNKAPILTELHRRPQELRPETTSYETPRSSNYSPVQGPASVPIHPPGHGTSQWSQSQPGAWSTGSGYSDLQPLPPASLWESSFSPEGWNEQPGPTWQPGAPSGPYGYSTIPPLPWQSLQDPSYTPGALDPATGQMYFGTATSPGFSEGFYLPNTGLGDQPGYSSSVPTTMLTPSGENPAAGYAPPGTGFQENSRTVNWQTQYPYLGALDVPPSEAFTYSPAPRHQSGGEAATSEYDQRSTGSPASPPDSSDRDSLTPTLTHPGYERAPASMPRKRWPFVRGPVNQPVQRTASAYTPASTSLGAPGTTPFRSFSALLPQSRVRLRSGSPEPAREASIRGAKRLKVNPSIPSSSHLRPPDVLSPPPLSAGSSTSVPRSTKSRVSSTVRSGSGAHRSHKTTSPTDQAAPDQPDDNTLLEILTRPAPYKRMLGYAARQHDGSVVAYELSDSVAATAGSDTLLGLGLSSVTNVAALGMELGRRAARRQQESGSRGVVEHTPATTTNVYEEHGIPQRPRGGDARTGHVHGATSKPGWHGCVIA